MNVIFILCLLSLSITVVDVIAFNPTLDAFCSLNPEKCLDQIKLENGNTVIEGESDVKTLKELHENGQVFVEQEKQQPFVLDSSFSVKDNGQQERDEILADLVKKPASDVEVTFWRDVIEAIAKDKLKKRVKRFIAFQLV